ncbi:hypothetical protein NPS53_09520 [Pseudomonas putida]|uniref:hypothetical protein n=1 Tax=Pseudomonas putida TaxID=303 RepID=UPI002363DDC5|nr:hypothetical protein [Pseudomonas putida]MDD2139816.1 hypothetical protein [Pseudomonas putida]HDS1721740.1 hypothetical protein [Pseudomonas putida]
MGSTVSTGKLIGAFEGSAGKPVYVMFEQSYDKNTLPRTPKWRARMIGDAAALLKNIFLCAASCEGGMLQGAGGRCITPEGHIASWLQELANPVEMADASFVLTVGKYWEAAIPLDYCEAIAERLSLINAGRVIDGLAAGGVTVSLHADSDVLSAIYDGTDIWASQIIKAEQVPVNGTRKPELGYKPAKSNVQQLDAPRFAMIHASLGSYLIQGEDGAWRCESGGNSYIADLVRDLWQDEAREPGSYRRRIKAYRASMDSASIVPQSTTIVVDMKAELTAWQHDSVKRALSETPHTIVGNEAHIPMPADFNQLYWLAGLPAQCTKWVLNKAPLCAPTEQLCLLAS